MTTTDRVKEIIKEMSIDQEVSINELYIFYLKAQIDLLLKMNKSERQNETTN